MTREIERAAAKKLAADKEAKKEVVRTAEFESTLELIKEKYNITDFSVVENSEVELKFELVKVFDKGEKTERKETGIFDFSEGRVYLKYFQMLNEKQKEIHIKLMKENKVVEAMQVFGEILL